MTDLTKLAQSILDGDTRPYGIGGFYDSADWIDAAEQALDPVDQDYASIRVMVAKEALWEAFKHSELAECEDMAFPEFCERFAA